MFRRDNATRRKSTIEIPDIFTSRKLTQAFYFSLDIYIYIYKIYILRGCVFVCVVGRIYALA